MLITSRFRFALSTSPQACSQTRLHTTNNYLSLYRHNGISESAYGTLAKSLRNMEKLEAFILHSELNNITETGALSIKDCLRNKPGLKFLQLYLRSNQITDLGATAIMDMAYELESL